MKSARRVVQATRGHVDIPLRKLEQMNLLCLRERKDIYSRSKKQRIEASLSALSFKYLLSSIHLEELWVLSMVARWELVDLVKNSVENSTWTDEKLVIGSKHLESFLFQARAFLNFYKFHACLVMDIEDPGHMTIKNFQTKMDGIVDGPFFTPAQKLKKYFGENVYAKGQWGWLLKGLRDKITHLDRLRPLREGSEEIVSIRLDWPTIQGTTFERLAQAFDNGVFGMLVDTAPLVYGQEWKSGPQMDDS